MKTFTCPQCGMVSHNETDLKEGYCGNCHDFTGADNLMDADPRERFGYDMYFDRNGVPITLRQYAMLAEDYGYRNVAQDTIGMYRVSTVWLGINHDFTGPGILIFETMVFLDGTPADMNLYRYATESEALAGHEAVCAEIRVQEELAKEHHPSHPTTRKDPL